MTRPRQLPVAYPFANLVRYHACESLLVRWGIEPAEATGHPEIFARMRGRSDDAPLEAHDFARLREARTLLEQLRDGRHL